MKEVWLLSVALLLMCGFLVGFSSHGTSYVQERQDYYRGQEAQAQNEQERAVYRLAANDVFLVPPNDGRTQPGMRRCIGGEYPRMTNISWMGASEEENRQWHIRNEQACLEQMKTRFQADGNEVGLRALEKISLPQA